MKKCLVTGGCGFIGSALTQGLVKKGWSVDVVDDLSTGDLDNLGGLKIRHIVNEMLPLYEKHYEKDRRSGDVLVINGDFADSNLVNRVKSGIYDVIFHVAALPRVAYSIEDPVFTTETNVLKTVLLFRAAAGNVDRVVYSSSSSVYGDADSFPLSETQPADPRSPYALQKYVCEKFASQFSEFYNLDVVCLRYFNVYGPKQRGNSAYATVVSAWCEALANGVAIRVDGDGEQSRDFTYVDDVVSANILAADCSSPFKGEAFNIAYGEHHSINDILELFSHQFGEMRVLYASPRPGDVGKTHADISAATAAFGYRPSMKLTEGLKKTWKWWQFES